MWARDWDKGGALPMNLTGGKSSNSLYPNMLRKMPILAYFTIRFRGSKREIPFRGILTGLGMFVGIGDLGLRSRGSPALTGPGFDISGFQPC
jgi:hypothetical protein